MRRSALQRLILAYLRKVSTDGEARVSLEEVAAATGSYARNVARSMRRLAADGVIDTKAKRGAGGCTTVTFPDGGGP